jgi:hypothetical protein
MKLEVFMIESIDIDSKVFSENFLRPPMFKPSAVIIISVVDPKLLRIRIRILKSYGSGLGSDPLFTLPPEL